MTATATAATAATAMPTTPGSDVTARAVVFVADHKAAAETSARIWPS